MAFKQYLKLIVFLCIVLFPLFISDVSSETLYRWTDKEGTIHLTDYPPSDKEALHIEQIDVKKKKEPEKTHEVKTRELPEPDLQRALEAELQSELNKLEDIDIEELMEMSGGNLPFPISGEMTQFLEVAGTAIFILIFALSIFINLYLALCVYLIARKTGVSYAWMSYIPVLNIFPLFGAAGYRWHVAFIIMFVVILFFLSSFFFPQLSMIITFIMVLGLFVFFVNLWMKVCENLGTSKWLGLLIIIPFINIFLPSYLAFKKETTWDGVRRLRPAVITLIVFLLIVGAYAISTPYLVTPQVKEMLSTITGGSVKEGTGIAIMPEPGSARPQSHLETTKE